MHGDWLRDSLLFLFPLLMKPTATMDALSATGGRDDDAGVLATPVGQVGDPLVDQLIDGLIH